MDDSITIVLDNRDILSGVCGANDGNLRVIEGSLGGRIAARGNEIRLEGADGDGVRRFKVLMDNLIALGAAYVCVFAFTLAGASRSFLSFAVTSFAFIAVM